MSNGWKIATGLLILAVITASFLVVQRQRDLTYLDNRIASTTRGLVKLGETAQVIVMTKEMVVVTVAKGGNTEVRDSKGHSKTITDGAVDGYAIDLSSLDLDAAGRLLKSDKNLTTLRVVATTDASKPQIEATYRNGEKVALTPAFTP